MMLRLLLKMGLPVLLLWPFLANAGEAETEDDLPRVIKVGSGSYASRPPRSQAARPGVQGRAGWGDLSQVFTHMKLWVREDYQGAVPSTDWWTSLVTRQWSGQLWSYPSMVKAEPQGVAIHFPRHWKLAGNKKKMVMESAGRLLVRGKGFVPEAAVAEDWSDWLVVFRMDQSSEQGMKVTLGHGLPCTWFETRGMDLRIDAEKPVFFSLNGANANLPLSGASIGVESNGDCYGIFAPEGTRFESDGASLAIRFSGEQKWITVAVLPDRQEMAVFQKWAAVVPRKTAVKWDYSAEKGELSTNWTLETENLAGGPERDVIQGWIPHHYDTAKGTKLDFNFNGLSYATPRGKLLCATGRSFNIIYPFRGLLPELPAPRTASVMEYPYRPEVMKQIIDGYTDVTGYGFETYWGGKKILLYAKYMEMAHQLGLDQEAGIFAGKLREALVDWATYEPGEPDHFFAMYPNWGSLVGFRTRDNQNPGIDVLQDHAFCYAYHVYAASLLAIHDKDFAKNYGGMATLMVKDYANWEREDTRFPFFRSMDPWCGHSWSGGTGSEEGNGQESSSEAVQAWGAMFVLGEVLGNKGMRDAAIFGYVSETRAIAEYWFDRDKENLPRDIWPNAYNSNLETNGVGWWTWFSGNEFWMHSIQWLPMSPLLKYLGEDQAFARWDYETMWKNKNGNGWEGDLGTNSGVGNITLSYLQLFDPTEAARIFDDLWDRNKGAVHAKEEPGPSYYRIHAGRTLGAIRWDAWSDIPTSTVYKGADGKTVVAVYNTQEFEQKGRLFEQGKKMANFVVPPQKLVAYAVDASGSVSVLASTQGVWKAKAGLPATPAVSDTDKTPRLFRIEVEPKTALFSDKQNQQFKAKGYDQFGNVIGITPSWKVRGKGSIDAQGLYRPNGGTDHQTSRFAIVAEFESVEGTAWAAVEESRRVSKIILSPFMGREFKMAAGSSIRFKAEVLDQFNARYGLPLQWSAQGNVKVSASGEVVAGLPGQGSLTVQAGEEKLGVEMLVQSPEEVNLAAFKPVTASSVEKGGMEPDQANDGNPQTRWASASSDPQWIMVDLEQLYSLEKVSLLWQNAAAKVYQIEVSTDGTEWKTAHEVKDGKAGLRVFGLNGVQGRYLRISGSQRTMGYGYSIFEIEAYGRRAP